MILELLHKLYAESNGRINRIHERLIKDENIQIAYSTLTKRYRELSIASLELEPAINHPCFKKFNKNKIKAELDQCMLSGKSYKNILKKMVLTNDMSKFPLN